MKCLLEKFIVKGDADLKFIGCKHNNYVYL
ncbi:hypothetical protein VIAQ111709_07160 [Vibrio aquimaris]|uniref:Uncharacterized protein n=1 Tax=Vibrio aquimaris TaxID=2587862 RepID=A0A5P9CJA0_9VIBR|nr:hypothetical protein FIV01_07675 [Vibrio aquimaris]